MEMVSNAGRQRHSGCSSLGAVAGEVQAHAGMWRRNGRSVRAAYSTKSSMFRAHHIS